jgi:hypothetical protein
VAVIPSAWHNSLMDYTVNVRPSGSGRYEWEIYEAGKALRISWGTVRGSYERATQLGNAEKHRLMEAQVPRREVDPK